MAKLSLIPAEDAYERWRAVSTQNAEERFSLAGDWLQGVVDLADDERDREIDAVLRAEARLSDAALLAMTGTRLRVMAELPAAAAQALMAAFQAAEQEQSASTLMRRVSALQGACKELTLDEIGKVQAFLPSAPQLAGLPAPKRQAASGADSEIREQPRRGLLRRLLGRA